VPPFLAKAATSVTDAKIILYDYPASICCQMTRLVLAEKGRPFERRHVDIMGAAEQFEAWYTALNAKAVVPTLLIGDEVVTDTIRIVNRIDREFEGPRLTPDDKDQAKATQRMMRDIMALHYGVLLYSRRLDADRRSPIIVKRGDFLRARLRKHPEQAAILDARIAGNERLQRILENPAEVARCIDEAKDVVARINDALSLRRFVCADRYTLADAFATAALARFRLHGFGDWWSDGANANVAGYYARMRSRSSWSAAGVVDSGAESDL
jgi:glutathione S-transferase